jgi:hypothetical protein
MDTGERWQVGLAGLRAKDLSPLGNHIFYYGPDDEIWISEISGNNLQLVFSKEMHPDLDLVQAIWLTDDILLVNAVNVTDGEMLLFELDARDSSLQQINEQRKVIISSPNGEFWVQQVMGSYEYEIARLDGETRPFTIRFVSLSEYQPWTFSPDGDQIAYLQRDEADPEIISLWVADINPEHGVGDPRQLLVDQSFATIISWSPDGRYIGFGVYLPDNRETRFRAVEIKTGEIVCDWLWPFTSTYFNWSARSNAVITDDGYLLDLDTGEVVMLFENEPYPSYVVNWRLARSRR